MKDLSFGSSNHQSLSVNDLIAKLICNINISIFENFERIILLIFTIRFIYYWYILLINLIIYDLTLKIHLSNLVFVILVHLSDFVTYYSSILNLSRCA